VRTTAMCVGRRLKHWLRPSMPSPLLAAMIRPTFLSTNRFNPYRGCEHGCSYCYSRPAHSYVNLSPGLDFETKLFYKQNAATLLDKELRRPGTSAKPIALGTNTDPYSPSRQVESHPVPFSRC